MEKICVAIRVKPPSIKQESATKGHEWKVVDKTIALCSAAGTLISGHSFSFDTIFGTSAKNADIYEQHAKAVVLSAVAGFNGTVFAYGQTSSGKTYTMRGSQAEPGVTWLAVDDVFRSIQEMSNREFLIRVSYMEIYNEEIKDLLSTDNRKLQIHESLERGVFVAGLREEIVDSVEQVLGLLESGEAQRHFGETNMNMYSSRSHTIFRMVIESRDKSQDDQDSDPDSCASDAVRVSALNLVDLAGSERIAKTGAGGVRLKEGGHINKSLMTLGNVINKLCDGGGKQGGHIPYRDSKLTRILQSALGGNARTAIICTITPDEIHIDETRGTLQFASRAKRVTNCAQVNETVTDAALLKRQKREIEELLQKLQGSPHSEDLEKEIRTLRNDLLQFEVEKEKLALELQEEKKAQVEREQRIKEQEQKIVNLSTLVISSAADGQIRVQRDRTLGLPPSFESLNEDGGDLFGRCSREATPVPFFENFADEETWATLNHGHGHDADEFLSANFSYGRQTSGVSEESNRSNVDGQLEILNNEKERISRALMEQLAINEEISRARKEEKLWLAKELQNYMVIIEENASDDLEEASTAENQKREPVLSEEGSLGGFGTVEIPNGDLGGDLSRSPAVSLEQQRDGCESREASNCTGLFFDDKEETEAISEIPTSLSKSALKNLAKQERYKELKQQRKALEKMKRHQETERKRQEWVQKLAGLSEEEIEKAKQEKMELRTARKDERKERREKLTQALETGQNIVIDLEFGQMMKPNEISSLLQQVMYSYAANGRAEAPCRLSLTGCTGDIHTQLEKISGFNNWLLHKQERSYLSVFEDRKEDLVYLTADSENILESLDPCKIYIVGGLVDRNRWKGVTLEKAKSQGIQTAKLPIGEHMKMLSSQVLTVNQVVEIMLRFAELGDWSKALFAVIPPRKRAAKEVLESVAKQTRISPEQISQNGEQAMDAMSEVGDDFVLVDLVKDIGNAESNVGKEIAQS
ncbi:unnamed protein product [Sphagnum balticum]